MDFNCTLAVILRNIRHASVKSILRSFANLLPCGKQTKKYLSRRFVNIVSRKKVALTLY